MANKSVNEFYTIFRFKVDALLHDVIFSRYRHNIFQQLESNR